jgi:hypothetical protein
MESKSSPSLTFFICTRSFSALQSYSNGIHITREPEPPCTAAPIQHTAVARRQATGNAAPPTAGTLLRPHPQNQQTALLATFFRVESWAILPSERLFFTIQGQFAPKSANYFKKISFFFLATRTSKTILVV